RSRGRASRSTGVPRLRGSGGAAEHAYEPCSERASLTGTCARDESGPGLVFGNGVRRRAQRQAAAPQPGGPTGPTPRTTPGTRPKTAPGTRPETAPGDDTRPELMEPRSPFTEPESRTAP